MSPTNEIPPVESDLRNAVQAHFDEQGGDRQVEQFIVVATYIEGDAAGIEIVTNVNDAARVVQTLGLATDAVRPSIPSTGV